MTTNNTPLLTIDNLDVKFRLDRETVHAVRGVSFSLNKGETLALVGESGSGKSVTAMSIVRLHPDNMTEYGADAKIAFEGVSMLDAPPETLRQLRGNRIGMIFQEPMTSLGVLISEGADRMETAPWMLIFPAIILATILFCFNFVGDGLRDALDPKDR